MDKFLGAVSPTFFQPARRMASGVGPTHLLDRSPAWRRAARLDLPKVDVSLRDTNRSRHGVSGLRFLAGRLGGQQPGQRVFGVRILRSHVPFHATVTDGLVQKQLREKFTLPKVRLECDLRARMPNCISSAQADFWRKCRILRDFAKTAKVKCGRATTSRHTRHFESLCRHSLA